MNSRQTTRPILHPQLGMGILTYRNGPAWFCSASGVREDYVEVGLDGWSVDEGVTLRVTPQGVAPGAPGAPIKVKCCGPHSPLHKRVMLYDGRRGWLVWTAPTTAERRPQLDFEPDDGSAGSSGTLSRVEDGPPGAWKRQQRRKSGKELPHEQYWSTYAGPNGFQLVFCREADAERVSWPKSKRSTRGSSK